MLPSALIKFRARLRGCALGAIDGQRVSLMRTFRADVPDTEPKAEDDFDEQLCCSPVADGPSSSGRQHTSTGGSGPRAPSEGYQYPVRVPQSTRIARRKVLGPSDEDFLGNVATLLVRWPHAGVHRQPQSWREVLDNGRFQYLFPRRTTPLTRQAIEALQALTAEEGDEDGGNEGGREVERRAMAPQAARQAALMELVEQLQVLQQHLQERSEDDGAFVAIISDSGQDSEADDVEEPGPSCSAASRLEDADARERNRGYATGTGSRQDGGVDRSGMGSGELGRRRTRGRLRFSPNQRDKAERPAPPWDDTKPFQTHVGTVYQFWRLCPYG